MQHLRIEYPSLKGADERVSLAVPNVATALVVAQIVHPEGEVQLWEGDHRLAVISRQGGALSPLWGVTAC